MPRNSEQEGGPSGPDAGVSYRYMETYQLFGIKRSEKLD